ncbi:hypothetical protein [Sulfitobacter geojensis]|uniref:hypothetical protein n=1 Tax=Sulfitobacter geojensis TaxID=1342299 RepID=UPI003B8CE967
MLFSEARNGTRILGIGPQHVMADAAFCAARIDESGMIEMRHGGTPVEVLIRPSITVSEWVEVSVRTGNQ